MGVDRPQNDIHSEIYIVDDDPMVRDALSEVFAQAGFRAVGFVDGASFLAAARERVPACIILDVYMPGRSGLEVLQELDATNYPAPIFIASGRGDIPTAVEAIKNGAFDFIEKRQDAGSLVTRVRDAIMARGQIDQSASGGEPRLRKFPGYDLLTQREREVLALITASATNKEAANSLGISQQTVEIHRAHIMHKLGAKNSVDLARKVLAQEPRRA